MKVRIKKLNEAAVIPQKAHPTDAGFDLVATSYEFDRIRGNYVYGTGLAFEIPEGYVGLLFPRSSISKGDLMLTNSVGVIDSHYRGEVTFKFKSTIRGYSLWSLIKKIFKENPNAVVYNCDDGAYNIGDRIGQLIIMPYPNVEFEVADELSATDRGEGGYGSTGR